MFLVTPPKQLFILCHHPHLPTLFLCIGLPSFLCIGFPRHSDACQCCLFAPTYSGLLQWPVTIGTASGATIPYLKTQCLNAADFKSATAEPGFHPQDCHFSSMQVQ